MPRSRTKKKSHGLLTLVIVSLVLILIATVGGLYLFGKGGTPEGGVTVVIDAPTTITSGDEVTYQITINNKEAGLAVADLTLEYPAGFIISTTVPAAANPTGQSLFHLAPLAVGQSVDVMVSGRLLGAMGTAAELRARLDYQPDNFHSNFHADAVAVIQVAAGRVRLAVKGPSVVVSPGQARFNIDLENVADTTLNGLQVVLEMPVGVAITSSTPPLAVTAGSELRYDIGTLDASGNWRAIFDADVAGNPDTQTSVVVAVYQRLGQQRVIIERSLLEMSVVQPSVAVDLAVNHATSSGQIVVGGTSVPLTITFRNTGSQALEQLILRLRLNGSAVEWERFIEQAGGRRDGDAIVWDSQTAGVGGSFVRLEPGDQGSVEVSMPTVGFVGMQPSDIQLVATLTSVFYGEDWQAAAGPVSVRVQ
jgi:hypothetical protein